MENILFISFPESRSGSLLDSTQLFFRPITPSPPTHSPVNDLRVYKAFRAPSKAISPKNGSLKFLPKYLKNLNILRRWFLKAELINFLTLVSANWLIKTEC
jgi:hypothetical protein